MVRAHLFLRRFTMDTLRFNAHHDVHYDYLGRRFLVRARKCAVCAPYGHCASVRGRSRREMLCTLASATLRDNIEAVGSPYVEPTRSLRRECRHLAGALRAHPRRAG